MTNSPLLPLLSVLFFSGCGMIGDKSQDAEVPSGTFIVSSIDETDGAGDDTAEAADLSVYDGVTVVIDHDAATLTLTQADGSAQTVDLVLRDPSAWAADCYTMNSHTLTEVYDVDADSLAIGPDVVAAPVLTAKCGGRPLLGEDGGAELFTGPVYVLDEASP